MKKTSGSRAQGGARCDRSQQQRHREGGMMVLVGQELELGTGSRIWRISLPTEMGANPRLAPRQLKRTAQLLPLVRLPSSFRA